MEAQLLGDNCHFLMFAATSVPEPPNPNRPTPIPTSKKVRPRPPQRWQRSPGTRQQLPLILRLFLGLQYGSSIVALGSMAIAVVLYSFTVYQQQAWNREYRQLRSLQKEERGLTAATQSLKSQLAKQGEGKSLEPNVGQTLFLVPDASAAFRQPPPSPKPTLPVSNSPLGY